MRKYLVAFLMAVAFCAFATEAHAQTATSTPTSTPTPTMTATPTTTPTNTPTVTITPTVTPTVTPTFTITPTPLPTAVPGPAPRNQSTTGSYALTDAWDAVRHAFAVIAWPAASSAGGATHVTVRNANATPVAVQSYGANLYGIHVVNAQAAITYVQVFDAVPANVTLGTTAPDFEMQVAASGTADAVIPSVGLQFVNGMTIAATTGEKGSTGSAAGVVVFVATKP